MLCTSISSNSAFWTLIACPLFVCVGCSQPVAKSPVEKTAPAKVELLPQETELATLTLTSDAARRLGITTSPVEMRRVSRQRTFAGEALVPSGQSIVASAPVPGIIAAAGDKFPAPGETVAVAQPLLVLKPLLSPERDVPTPAEQVQMTGAKANLVSALTVAQGEVARSESEIAGLVIARDRAQQLLKDRAGSRRAADDADAQLNIARSVLKAASQREQELDSMLQSLSTKGTLEPASPLTLTAPMKGLVRSVTVSAGQTVTTGAPLFEVVNLDTIWIRVPIYVDLLSTLQSTQPATLVSLDGSPLGSGGSDSSDRKPVHAMPVAAPPTADAASSSADLYYEVDNRRLGLRPGQRVGVNVPLTTVADALVVPTAAVLYDIYGGTWVYVEKSAGDHPDAKSRYERRRVSLRWVEGDSAILSAGPPVGTPVVIDGAAELFGTEFGAGK